MSTSPGRSMDKFLGFCCLVLLIYVMKHEYDNSPRAQRLRAEQEALQKAVLDTQQTVIHLYRKSSFSIDPRYYSEPGVYAASDGHDYLIISDNSERWSGFNIDHYIDCELCFLRKSPSYRKEQQKQYFETKK